MKFNKKIITIKILLPIIMTLIISLPIIVINTIIPDNLKFFVNQEHNIEYTLPLGGNLASNERVLKINNKEVQDNINLSFDRPFSILFQELGQYNLQIKLFGILPVKTVQVDVVEQQKLIPCGKTIGVKIKTNGILVLGTGQVQGIDGNRYNPCKGALYSGDLILTANDKQLTCKEDLIETICESKENDLRLKVSRDGSIVSVNIKPIKSIKDDSYKIGIWVRDSTQGIGTITYINPKKMSYGALGHPITDIDTKEIMSLKDGEITDAKIISIKKGQIGEPGEIEGILKDSRKNVIGNVKLNVNQGIFGEITNENIDLLSQKPLPIAFQHEVVDGRAQIISNIEDNKIKVYDVNLQRLPNFNNNSSKGMIVEIIDKELISKTNGIIQGMSGSPIIQNGKLVGAVTHVFVQNPEKGYGIFIENMIKEEKKIHLQ